MPNWMFDLIFSATALQLLLKINIYIIFQLWHFHHIKYSSFVWIFHLTKKSSHYLTVYSFLSNSNCRDILEQKQSWFHFSSMKILLLFIICEKRGLLLKTSLSIHQFACIDVTERNLFNRVKSSGQWFECDIRCDFISIPLTTQF